MSAENYDKAKDVEQNKVMAILAYFGILVLIPIFAAKESRFARFHANQGLTLWIAGIVYGIIYSIVTFALTAALGKAGAIIGSIVGLVSIIFLVLMIIGIINAAKGEEKELPIIGKYKMLKQ